MNKKILLSIMTIGLIAMLAGTGLLTYFSDTETSTGNVFTAGTIDISIDPTGGQDVVTVEGTLDLKPCETGYTTTTITNDGTNPATIWKHVTNVENDENEITDAEGKYYTANSGSDGWLISNWIHYDMLVYKSLGYSWSGTVGGQPVSIDVNDGEGQVTWTIDFPMEPPYDQSEGNGILAVGLVIALDGNGNGPAFQIHNNDGTTTDYPHGMWLYSPWGPTINDGWMGWHSGDTNTPVTDLDWVSCTGDRWHENNPDGLFTITIDKCELVGDIHWALNLAIGGGFTTYAYEQMSCPAGNFDYFDWATPLVTMLIPNYEAASISTLIKEIPESDGFYLTGNLENGGVASQWIYLGRLEPGETMCVIQSYHLDATVDNWGQSDRVWFDIEFLAQQTAGTPPPGAPGPVLPGHGLPG